MKILRSDSHGVTVRFSAREWELLFALIYQVLSSLKGDVANFVTCLRAADDEIRYGEGLYLDPDGYHKNAPENRRKRKRK